MQLKINKDEWPPKYPDPVDYYFFCFWNALKEKVYSGQLKSFTEKLCWEREFGTLDADFPL